MNIIQSYSLQLPSQIKVAFHKKCFSCVKVSIKLSQVFHGDFLVTLHIHLHTHFTEHYVIDKVRVRVFCSQRGGALNQSENSHPSALSIMDTV